MKVRELAVH